MARKSQKQKQKQKQSQAVIVNVSVPPKRRSRGKGRKRVPKQSIEEAEYISALNRTMPAVQVNPIPAVQQPAGIPILKPEHLESLVRDVAKSEAHRQMQIRQESVEDFLRKHMEPDIPEGSNFSFKPTRDVVPKGEPLEAPWGQPIPLMAPKRGQELTDMADKPREERIPGMEGKPQEWFGVERNQQADFPKATMPASMGIPINRPDGDYAFANTTVTSASYVDSNIPRPKGRPRIAKTPEQLEEERLLKNAKAREKRAEKKKDPWVA